MKKNGGAEFGMFERREVGSPKNQGDGVGEKDPLKKFCSRRRKIWREGAKKKNERWEE